MAIMFPLQFGIVIDIIFTEIKSLSENNRN